MTELEERITALEKNLARFKLWTGYFLVILAAVAIIGLMAR